MSLRPRDLLLRGGEGLQLESLTGDLGLDRVLPDADLASPGLVLAGYIGRFVPDRIHVLGETEITYLASLDTEARVRSLQTFFSYDLPLVIITKGQEPPEPLLALAQERAVAVFRTPIKTAEFYRRIKPLMEGSFAPRTTLHGSLADVYGVGLLFVGRSGIGKSECVLDLIERGHRLVADDVVQVSRRGSDVLIGQGHELAAHHMEIRGIGLIDIPALFGIRSVRQQKRVEVVVRLEDWETAQEADRTGLSRQTMDILGVQIPKVIVPLNPGKNLTVISEVVAMSHLLRFSGVDVAQAFNERLIKRMKEQRGIREYLQEDFE
ncbi:MAG TPA: HPr(Ser) kinase/phosphatase [Gemmatimonadales bacterium]|nr:HPr(Ser) kinase/phosphatase [Gemmatimonadales bacterium]